ncbi:MAG TPA: pentapeptide repeat-containing protein [Acidimicrobiales bacterium]|nr:pentapeptide repeat-containing protein [Acidimicrobiales bacterium]
MTPEPAPRRATPVAAPDLRDELTVVEDLVLHDDERVEDVDTAACGLDADQPIEGLQLRRVRLVGPAWTGVTLRDLHLRDVVIEGGELAGVSFEGATFERVAFLRCRLSGIVAPALRATDVRFVDCRMEEAWLRAATLERAAFEDCALPRADLYAARVRQSRFERCDLTEVELSQAELDDVAFHGSRIEGITGGAALRNAVIGSDQLLVFAGPVLHAAGIVVDDDYLRAPDEPA